MTSGNLQSGKVERKQIEFSLRASDSSADFRIKFRTEVAYGLIIREPPNSHRETKHVCTGTTVTPWRVICRDGAESVLGAV
jgi:hypothetical protein